MAIRSRFDAQVGILFTTADGLLSFAVIQEHLDEETRSDEIAHPEIFDATQARTDLTAEEVRALVKRLVEMSHNRRFGPTAVICTNEVVCGMASMLGILSDIADGPQVQAFRTFDEGLNWLIRVKPR